MVQSLAPWMSPQLHQLYKQRAMIKMGNTYCDRFSSHFALKPTDKGFSLTFLGLYWGLWDWKRGQLGKLQQICQLGTLWKKGNLVFDLKHFWDALQTFLHILGNFCECLGRVSVGSTVNKSDVRQI